MGLHEQRINRKDYRPCTGRMSTLGTNVNSDICQYTANCRSLAVRTHLGQPKPQFIQVPHITGQFHPYPNSVKWLVNPCCFA